MHEEIERKWLVETLPCTLLPHGAAIQQGYLAVSERGEEVRLRVKGKRYFLTVKGRGDLARAEEEIELEEEQFRRLWPFTATKRLAKTRHLIELDHFIAELDIYNGSLEGLRIVEVEFSNLEQSQSFQAPEWFGKEVTEDARYKNRSLALYGIPK